MSWKVVSTQHISKYLEIINGVSSSLLRLLVKSIIFSSQFMNQNNDNNNNDDENAWDLLYAIKGQCHKVFNPYFLAQKRLYLGPK